MLQQYEYGLLLNNLKQYVCNNPGTILFARLAEDLINNGKINEAIQVCELGLKINPNYAPGYFVLSLALRKQRKKGEAAHSFSRAVENDPNYRHITLRDFQNKIFSYSKSISLSKLTCLKPDFSNR